jgi:beta-xylosidase
VNLFSTTDFVTWVPHGNVLPLGAPRPAAVLFSPKVLFNDRTRQWVLWYNCMPPYNYAVATSPSPFGPFLTISNTAANTTQFGNLHNNSHCGDFSLFKDDDGAGYLLYSSDAHVQVERLTDDFYQSAWLRNHSLTSGVLPFGNEAPAMFKRGGSYYALVSDSCCYCGGGGQVRAFMAPAPLGPYTYTGDVTRGANPFGTGGVTTSSQQTNVFRVGSQLVWMGDRWQSAPGPTRFKGQDFTAWFLLGFAGGGAVSNITWADEIQITV